MKKIKLALLTSVFVLAGCSTTVSNNDKTTTIKTVKGDVEVKVNPKTVAVFDLSVLENLDVLNVEVAGLPRDGLPEHLKAYDDDKYVNIGNLKEPDLEALSKLNPDVIIISGRLESHYEALSKIAPTIYLDFEYAQFMASFEHNLNVMATLFEKTEAVDAEVKKIKDQIAIINEAINKDEKSLIILANEGKLSAYGSGSRFSFIHDVLEFVPVDTSIEISTHGQSITYEYILEKNPDRIFVVDRGAIMSATGALAKADLENAIIQKTNAFKKDQIIYLDANYWYLAGTGIISVNAMIQQISQAIGINAIMN